MPTFGVSKEDVFSGGDDLGLTPTLGGTSSHPLVASPVLRDVVTGMSNTLSSSSTPAGEGPWPRSMPARSTIMSTSSGMHHEVATPTPSGGTTDSSFLHVPFDPDNLFHFDASIASATCPAETRKDQALVTHRGAVSDSDVPAPTHPERRDAETRV